MPSIINPSVPTLIQNFTYFLKNPDIGSVVLLSLLLVVQIFTLIRALTSLYKFYTNLSTDIQLGLYSIFSIFFCVSLFLIQKNIILGYHSDLDSYIISISLFFGLYMYVQCITALQPTYNISLRIRQIINTLTTMIILFIICGTLVFNTFSRPVQLFDRFTITPSLNDITKLISFQFVISLSESIVPMLLLELGEFTLITILISFIYMRDKKVKLMYTLPYILVINKFYFSISDILYLRKSHMMPLFEYRAEANKFISDIGKIIFKNDIYFLFIVTIILIVIIMENINSTLMRSYNSTIMKKQDYKNLLKKVSKEIKDSNGEINNMQLLVVHNLRSGIDTNLISKKDIDKLISLVKDPEMKKIAETN